MSAQFLLPTPDASVFEPLYLTEKRRGGRHGMNDLRSNHFTEPVNRKRPPSPPTKSPFLPARVLFPSATDTDPFVIPGTSNFYLEQVKRIGSGSFGDVYLVKRTDANKQYALKRARKPFRGRTDKQKAKKEADKMRIAGKHPFCVRCYGAWEDPPGFLALLMEYCPLGSLEEIFANRLCVETELWRILAQVSQGLSYLHSHGILHLDIKPANLLSPGPQIVKIGDFGIALMRQEEEGNRQSTAQTFAMKGLDTSTDEDDTFMEGDNRYMAPELLRDVITPAADIFSLGMSLLELATNVELPSHGALWHKFRDMSFFNEPCILPSEMPSDAAGSPDSAGASASSSKLGSPSPSSPPSSSWLGEQYGLSDALILLLQAMLNPEPERRCTLEQILSHPSIQPFLLPPDALFQSLEEEDHPAMFCLDADSQNGLSEEEEFRLWSRDRNARSAARIASSAPFSHRLGPGCEGYSPMHDGDDGDSAGMEDVARRMFFDDEPLPQGSAVRSFHVDAQFAEDDDDMTYQPCDLPSSDLDRLPIKNLLDDF
eukprot:ANDGO_03901.mRNA.1 putative protein kinase DDB_G0291842